MPFSDEIRALTQTPTYLESDDETRQYILKDFRDSFIKDNPDQREFAEAEAERARIEELRITGKGRYIPENLEYKAPWQSEDFSYLTEEEKENAIEEFRKSIPEIAASDTLNRNDIDFYLNKVADAQLRKAKGEDTGFVADKLYRAWDGFAAGLASYVGAEGIADAIRNSTSENPTYDEDISAQLFQGAGDLLASTTVFLGAALGTTAITGSPVAGGYAGTAATLGSNSIMRYNEAYRKAIELGYDEQKAHDSGIASLPGAAIDALGDKLIAGKFLPNSQQATFVKGTLKEKQEILSDLIKDKSTRGRVMNFARDAFVEGATETIGDYAASYGGYIETRDADFLPTEKEMQQSFLIGALLGGGVSIATEIPGMTRGDKKVLEETQSEINRILDPNVKSDEGAAHQIFKLLNEGKYKDALKFSRGVITSPKPTTEAANQIDPATGEIIPSSENQSITGLAEMQNAALPTDGTKPAKDIKVNSGLELQKSSATEEVEEVSDPVFLASNEQNESVQQELVKKQVVNKDLEQERKEEEAAAALLEKTKAESKLFFIDTVRNQLKMFTEKFGYDSIIKSLGTVKAETKAAMRGIRAGVINAGASFEGPAAMFVRNAGKKINNIELADFNDSSTLSKKGLADFAVLNRTSEKSSPIGKFNVESTESLNTKIQEAVALGRQESIVAIAPVNTKDEQFLNDNNIPFLDVTSVNGVGKYEYESGDPMVVAETEESVKEIVSKLNQTYGEGKWILKDSVGFGGYGILNNEADILAAFNEGKADPEKGGLILNGLYAENRIDKIAIDERKAGTDFRVHAVKRNGKIEIIPYATHSRSSTVPFFIRTYGIRQLENAALEALNKASDKIKDNEFFGVDVVIDTNNDPFVTELNPTNFGESSLEYGLQSGQSGYIDSEYVQSAVYSHLKGRVPAFVLAARKIMREELQQQLLAQGPIKIGQRLTLIYTQVSDAIAFKKEIVKNYGDRFADYANELYTEFTNSAGQLTNRIVDIIQRIVRAITRPIDTFKPSAVNAAIHNSVKQDIDIKQSIAKAITNRNRQSEKKDPTKLNVNFGKPEVRFNIPNKNSAVSITDQEELERVSPGYKSRDILIEMPIDDFLNLAESLNQTESTKKRVSDLVESIKQNGLKEIPFLSIESMGSKTFNLKVYGHEGRHRSLALKELGYTHMPVLMRATPIRWSEQGDTNKFDYYSDWPQRILNEEGNSIYPFVIPRSAYEDFKTSGIQSYSFEQQKTKDLKVTNIIEDLKSMMGVDKLPSNIKVINDPNVTWAGKNSRRYSITLNAALIPDIETAREVFLEEAIHSVWRDQGIQDAWKLIKDRVSEKEIQKIKDNYASAGIYLTDDAALEEAAIEIVIRDYKKVGDVKRFITEVWNRIKELFGISQPEDTYAAARIIHRALMYQREINENERAIPAHPVNAHTFDNGQVAGPGQFYITLGHSTKGRFQPDSTNPLGRFDHSFMGTGEGAQAYGWGTYLWQSSGTRDAYLSQFDNSIGASMNMSLSDSMSLLRDKSIVFDESALSQIKDGKIPNVIFDHDPLVSWIVQRSYPNLIYLKRKDGYVTSLDGLLVGLLINRYHAGRLESTFKNWIFEDIVKNADNKTYERISKLINDTVSNIEDKILGGRDLNRLYSSDAIKYTMETLAGSSWEMSSRSFQVRFNVTENELLDWDESFENQPEKVRLIIRNNSSLRAYIEENDDITYPSFGDLFYRWLSRETNPSIASNYLRSIGIKGIKFLDGSSRRKGQGTYNYVVFSDSDIEIMSIEQDGSTFDLEKPGDLVRYDQERYNVPRNNKSKTLKTRLKRLLDIKRIKINDAFDGHTSALVGVLKKIRPSEIKLLNEEGQERFWELVDNIHQARVESTMDPQLRIDYSTSIAELGTYADIIDSLAIEAMIKNYNHLDLSGLDNTDRETFTKELNELLEADADFQEKKKNKSAKDKARYDKKLESWRKTFLKAREEIKVNFPTAEDYLENFEGVEGQPVKGQNLRKFMMMHYDYLMDIVDVEQLEGKDLFRHTFAINNLLDGNFMYGAQTTARYIASLKNSQTNFESLRSKFRDPVINQGRGFFGGLDEAQQFTEIAQTRLGRWSSFVEAKDWLQNDLMGDFFQSITIEAQNNESASLRLYDEAKKAFQEAIERDMNSEDRVVMSFVSRLIQFKAGANANQAFIENIKNERKAFMNVVGGFDKDGNAVSGAGTQAQQDEYNNIIIPIFDKLVAGIENSAKPMEDFMINLNSRIGLGDEKVGLARRNLLSRMQDIIGEYYTDNKVVSEAFHSKPFTAYVNYLPRLVVPFNPEKFNPRDSDITAEVEEFDMMPFQSNSIQATPQQLKNRTGIGENSHYSNNIEYIFTRGLHVSSLTSSTTAARFVLNHRLHDKQIRSMINGSNSSYRTDQLQQWARTLMLNAMHSGQPLGTIGVIMKTLNENFARVSLSGLHQGITQTVSGYTDYHVRTGNINGAMNAGLYYIQNKKDIDEWFQNNAAWIGNRSFLGEQELDRRRAPSFDESKILNSPFVRQLTKYHAKAGEIITFSLRQGDDFTAKSLVMAEYTRLVQDKIKLNSANIAIPDIDSVMKSEIEGNLLSQAVLNVEQNINASNKVTRGEFFVDRHKGMSLIRNITVAFSSHVMMLAAQFNIAARDLVDLHNQGGSNADKIRAIRTMGAILSQTFMFTSMRHVINGGLALAMIQLIREMFDDEEGKIAKLEMRVQHAKDIGNEVMQEHAENELKAAIQIRRQIDKFAQRQTGFSSYWKNAVKDELGSIHFIFNGPQLPQKLIFPIFDRFGEDLVKEDNEARVSKLKAKIKTLKKLGKYGQASKLSEDLVLLENAEYMPWHIDQYGNIGIGGITGTSLDAIWKTWKEFVGAAGGVQEININDFILSAQSAGVGQADLTRFFKVVDKIENEQFKNQKEREENRKATIERIRTEDAMMKAAIEEDRALREAME